MTAYLSGFSTGAGLIIAIGAQNAFVLTNGVKKNHHFKIALICAAFDVFFIMLGVAGVGSLVASNQYLLKTAAYGGAVFLFIYGFRSLMSAFKEQSLRTGDAADTNVRRLILATLAVTLLNPHMYLDTVVLLGSISAQYQDKYLFGLGASTASVMWFFLLVGFSAMMSKVFARPIVWRMLDVFVALTMWTVAAHLVI
ncbi:MAG: LysE/ArgO family amino acid transporter [Deferribacterales bacterium]